MIAGKSLTPIYTSLLVTITMTLLHMSSPSAAAQAANIELRDGKLAVEISAATGQILAIRQDGNPLLLNSTDRYKFGRFVAEESGDRVKETSGVSDRAAKLLCRNSGVPGLEIVKEYRLENGRLVKSATYAADQEEPLYFELNTTSSLPEASRAEAIFYSPVFDGWMLDRTLPFTRFGDLETKKQITSPSLGIALWPSKNLGIVQTKTMVNGEPVWPSSVLNGYVLPDGWQLGLTVGYLSDKTPLSVQTDFVITDCDTRSVHAVLPELPALKRNTPVPGWFGDVKFYSHHPIIADIWAPETRMEFLRTQENFLDEQQKQIAFAFVWSADGDYRTEGTLFPKHGPPDVVEAGEFRKKFRAVGSEKTVAGLYAMAGNIFADSPLVNPLPSWVLRDAGNGAPKASSFNTRNYICYPGDKDYQKLVHQQYRDMLSFYGARYLYVDWTYWNEVVDEANRRVDYHGWKLLRDLAKIADENGTILFANSAVANSFADGGFIEYSYDWQILDKTDWRSLADMFEITKSRFNRVDRWASPLYWALGYEAYASRVLLYGAKPSWFWVRPSMRRILHQVPITELAWELRHFPSDSKAARIAPDWRRFETDTLESHILRGPGGTVMAGLINRDSRVKAPNPKLTLPDATTRRFVWHYKVLMNLFDLQTLPPENIFALDYLGFRDVGTANEIELPMPPPGELHFHAVTETPVFVYSVDGKRRHFLLADSKGVEIGDYQQQKEGQISFLASSQQPFEVLCAVPWQSVQCKSGEEEIPVEMLEHSEQRFVKVSLPAGAHQLVIAQSPAAADTKTTLLQAPEISTAALSAKTWEANPPGHVSMEPSEKNTWKIVFSGGGPAELRQTFDPARIRKVAFDVRGSESAKFTLHLGNHSQVVECKPGEWQAVSIDIPAEGDSDHPASVENLRLAFNGSPTVLEVRKLLLLPTDEHAAAETKIIALPSGGSTEVTLPTPEATDIVLLDRGDHLEVRFACEQSKIASYILRPRDESIWAQDSVEIYLMPKDGVYYQIASDPAGSMFDLQNRIPIRDIAWDGNWTVKTTVGEPGWSAVFLIPYEAIGGKPAPGSLWKFNLARNIASGNSNGAWSLGSGGFAEHEKWPSLRFEEQPKSKTPSQ